MAQDAMPPPNISKYSIASKNVIIVCNRSTKLIYLLTKIYHLLQVLPVVAVAVADQSK